MSKGPMKTYLKSMHKKFGYRANWEPKRKMEVGLIGKLFKGQFVIYSSLEKEGVPAQIESQGGSGNLEFTSEGGVHFTTKLKGELKPPQAAELDEADAGVIIEFQKEDSVVFKAQNTINHVLTNLKDVEKAFIDKINDKSDDLDKDYVLITEVVEADSATVVVSNKKNAKMEIKANAEAEIKNIDIADASLELKAVGQRNIETKVIAKANCQVLYKAMGIKKKFFGGDAEELKIKSIGEVQEGEQLFEEIPFSEDEIPV